MKDKINVDEVIKEVGQNHAIILDVRRDEEWNEGHISGAVHYELSRIENGELPAIPKNTKIYTHCRGGGRGTRAMEELKESGFENVVCLGGFSEWQDAGGLFIS